VKNKGALTALALFEVGFFVFKGIDDGHRLKKGSHFCLEDAEFVARKSHELIILVEIADFKIWRLGGIKVRGKNRRKELNRV
jgi:hypothetical protein